MANKLIVYAVAGGIIGGGMFYISSLHEKVAFLETQVETQKLQIKIHADNVALLTEQLAFEAENNEIGQTAISELKEEVPHVDFNTPLPPSVQGVLDRFHSRIRD